MAIAIRKDNNLSTSISELFDELDFKPRHRVYIKPNLCGREPIRLGENTSIEVLDALIDVLYSYDCEIIIGHGALLGSSDHTTTFNDTLRQSGYDKYLSHDKATIINLDKLERTKVNIEEMTFHLPLKFLKEEIDTYINLAKIKTHMETSVSFSLKNQMGLPAPQDRIMMHKTNLSKTIAKLALYCKPDLNILEGFPAMEKNGPHHGIPKNLNLIAASTDMVELDSFVSLILNYDLQKIQHIKYAFELGVGKYFDSDKIEVYNDFFVNDFQKAVSAYKFGRKMFAYPTFSCSRCINAVNLSGREFKIHPLKYIKVILNSLFSFKKINIIFGHADLLDLDLEGKMICIGSCSKKFANQNNALLLDKCPPTIDEAKEFIVRNV